MGWVWIDDLMPENAKVLKAGPLAAWLHVCGIAYCNRNDSEGRVPAAQVARLADIPKPLSQVQRLVSAGLWHEADGDYLIHDYGDYQMTREQREARRKAGRKGAQRRWGPSGNSNGKPMGRAKA